MFDRRHFLAGMAGLAADLLAPRAAGATDEPKLISDDYAEARRRFRTHLLRNGPAPDQPQSLEPPAGARSMTYPSGSLDLVAWLSPAADPRRPAPAVLFLHGGNALWPGHWDLTKPYRDAGYIAMMPALRAENGQSGAFSGFYDETEDVLAAAELLRQMPGVDPTRLFLAGHSVGGTLTLLAALAMPIFRAACAFSPNPDARAFFRRFPEDIRFDASDPREFDMRSAACFAGSIKCPMLMLHGSEEHGSEQAMQLMASRAEAAHLPVRRGVVPGSHTGAIPRETAESLAFFTAA